MVAKMLHNVPTIYFKRCTCCRQCICLVIYRLLESLPRFLAQPGLNICFKVCRFTYILVLYMYIFVFVVFGDPAENRL